jgi:hypothetical protein
MFIFFIYFLNILRATINSKYNVFYFISLFLWYLQHFKQYYKKMFQIISV